MKFVQIVQWYEFSGPTYGWISTTSVEVESTLDDAVEYWYIIRHADGERRIDLDIQDYSFMRVVEVVGPWAPARSRPSAPAA